MADLHDIKAQIDALSQPDKLRLAASLLEAGRPKLAHRLAESVVLELAAAEVLAKLGPAPAKSTDPKPPEGE